MERLRARLTNLLGGFWLVPGATALVLAGAGVGLVELDRAAGPDGIAIGFDGDAAAARDILTVVAGSLITVVALTLSLTVVTLQLVAGQFTPRAVRGLLADRLTQVVAGAFVGSVAYALIVLRSIREPGGAGGELRPSLSTTVGIALALVALALLIVFVHHVAQVIQVSSILGRVGQATLGSVERLYPEGFDMELDAAPVVVDRTTRERPSVTAFPPRTGYVQAVGLDDLARRLDGSRVHVVVHVQPGDFVTLSTPAIDVWGAADEDTARRVASKALVVADERDLRQDAAFGLQQLADIAVRALSPGINDPTTAITAIGWSRAVLEVLASRNLETSMHLSEDDRLTIEARRRGFDDYLEVGIREIARYATADARVTAALLDALAAVGERASAARAGGRLERIVRLARDVAAPARNDARTDTDRRAIDDALARVEQLPG